METVRGEVSTQIEVAREVDAPAASASPSIAQAAPPSPLVVTLRRWLSLPEVRAALIATALLRLAGGMVVALVCYYLNGTYFHVVQLTQHIQSQDNSGAIYAGPTPGSPFVEYLTDAWIRWDAGHYLAIARDGYYYPVSTAYLPLYPLLIRLLSYPLGGHFAAAALVISTLATFCTFLLLYRLVLRLTASRQVATYSIIVAALLPIAFFLVAPYTESLYLAISLATVLAVLDRHWGRAMLLAGLASLTRNQGVVLALLAAPTLFHAIRNARPGVLPTWQHIHHFWLAVWRPIAFATTSLGMYMAWLLYVHFALRAPTPFEQVTSSSAWHLRLTLPGLGLISDVLYLAQDPGFRLLYDHAHVLDLVASLLALVGLIVARRQLPSALLLYLVACWCVALIQVELSGITMSTARFQLALLPLCMVPAGWLARSRPFVRLSYVFGSVLLGCMILAEWVLWLWVS
ncbi:MAG: mannosyltransferase family protein [Ktedonobacterales bacterium]